MRAPLAVLLASSLAACAPPAPQSGAELGSYGSYMQSREAQLSGQSSQPGAPLGAPPAPVFSTEAIGSAINNAEGGNFSSATATPYAAPLEANSGVRPRGNAPMGIREEMGEMQPNHVGISDENDFAAVSARETIQSDAERIAQNRAQYQVIPPTPLPQRSGTEGPNIVQFALSTSHAPGTPMYRRSSLRLTNPGAACAGFASPDLAQEAFLASGGPTRDRKGLDPDGDGYACGWDPRPFRN
ncbi:MAG: hypothetical protein JG765_2123 [Cereibacter sp.]|jgi:hypothetical protein|nr:hypothetical protein [Cereibacter sp.]